jgi:hypothetical protein
MKYAFEGGFNMKLTPRLVTSLIGMIAIVISTVIIASQQNSDSTQGVCPFAYNDLITKSGLDTTNDIALLSRVEPSALATLNDEDSELLIAALKNPLHWDLVDAKALKYDYFIIVGVVGVGSSTNSNFYYSSTDNKAFFKYEDLHQQELLDLMDKHMSLSSLSFPSSCFRYAVEIAVPDKIQNLVNNARFELPH